MSSRKSTDAAHRRSTSAPNFAVIVERRDRRCRATSTSSCRRRRGRGRAPRTAAVRRGAVGHDADEQRRLEPPAVLVVRLEVEVGRPGQPGEAVVVAHREVRGAGVEPDVEDVALLLPRRAAALRAGEARRGRSRRPAARTRRRRRRRRRAPRRGRRSARAASRSAPSGQTAWHASLAHTSTVIGEPQRRCRDTHHSKRFSTIPAMRASPHGGTHGTRCDLGERLRAQVDARVRRGVRGERDEVLLGGAEDHRLLAAPAVRVLVLAARPRRAARRARASSSVTRGLASKHVHAGEVGDLVGVAAAVVDRRDDRDPLDLAGAEVVLAVARRGVHEAGAGVEGDVVGRRR